MVALLAVLTAALWMAIGTAYAATGALTSSANPSIVGQEVTFTWNFTLGCADGFNSTFTIDGQSFPGQGSIKGINATTTYTTSFSTSGDHTVVATYDGSPMPNCTGTSPVLVQTVSEPAAPATSPPSPVAEPSPSPSPSPSESPAESPAATPTAPLVPVASGTRVNLTNQRTPAVPGTLVALVAIFLSVATFIAAVIYNRPKRG